MSALHNESISTPLGKASYNPRSFLAAAILSFVGGVFVLKYAGRHMSHGWIDGILYVAVFLVAVWGLTEADRKRILQKFHLNALLLISFMTLASIIAVVVLPDRSDVSRLPAITAWLNALFSGHYPYGTSLNPSAFPGLFFAASPFYLLGNTGLLEAAGILLFGISALILSGRDSQRAKMQLMIMMLLPTTYYELVTRSELLFNMSLIAVLMLVADERVDPSKRDSNFFFTAILLGLALSTRSIVALLYSPYVVFKFLKKSLFNGLIFSLTVIAVFFATFLPFIIWNSREFMLDGPFAVQFGYVPFWMMGVSLVLSIVIGLSSKDIEDIFFYAGILLFLLVLWAFVARVVDVGWQGVFLRNRFDVGYFIFCVPYLVLSIGGSGKAKDIEKCEANPEE